jgi:hypothetical protein
VIVIVGRVCEADLVSAHDNGEGKATGHEVLKRLDFVCDAIAKALTDP